MNFLGYGSLEEYISAVRKPEFMILYGKFDLLNEGWFHHEYGIKWTNDNYLKVKVKKNKYYRKKDFLFENHYIILVRMRDVELISGNIPDEYISYMFDDEFHYQGQNGFPGV